MSTILSTKVSPSRVTESVTCPSFGSNRKKKDISLICWLCSQISMGVQRENTTAAISPCETTLLNNGLGQCFYRQCRFLVCALVVARFLWSLFCWLPSSLEGRAAGQTDASPFRKYGPSNHALLSAKSLAERLLVAKSAWFIAPETCLHCSGLVLHRISTIRLPANGLNQRLWFSQPVPTATTSTMLWARPLERTAPTCSSLGIVIAFTGDRRRLDAIRRDERVLSWYQQTK